MSNVVRNRKPPEFKPRKCKYCKLIFTPKLSEKNKNPHNAEMQRFCCENHRKSFHRNGGLNWERFTGMVDARVEKKAREVAREEWERIRDEMKAECFAIVRTVLNLPAPESGIAPARIVPPSE